MNQQVMWILGSCVLIVLILVFRFVRRKEIELEQAFQNRFAGHQILYMDKHAQIIGQQSHGFSQTSGMGYLVLTSQELYFKLQLMNREISIPVSSLLSVGETRRMKGKGTLRTMLKVDFRTIDGKEDAIALLVKDLSRWKAELSSIMGNQ